MTYIPLPAHLAIQMVEVDNLAREYCRQIGTDPDAKVNATYGADLTPPERATDDYIQNNRIPLAPVTLEAWRIVRPQAYNALAMQRAMTICGHLPPTN